MSRASLVDISKWQGTVDMQPIKAAGFVGTVSRCTVGWSYLDEQYERNREQSRLFEMITGAYHVIYPSNKDPVREADWFLSKVGDVDFYVLDVELTHGLTLAAVQAQCRQWLDHVAARTDKRIVVYTGSWFWRQAAGWENEFPLWEAEYTHSAPRGGIDRTQQPDFADPGVLAVGWTEWKLWQWTSGGKPLGAQSQSMDYNVCAGNEEQLRDWLGLDTEEPPEEPETVRITVSGPQDAYEIIVQ